MIVRMLISVVIGGIIGAIIGTIVWFIGAYKDLRRENESLRALVRDYQACIYQRESTLKEELTRKEKQVHDLGIEMSKARLDYATLKEQYMREREDNAKL